MHFPTWQFHAEHGAKLFKTEEELKAAGAGWFDHPDKAKTQEPPVIQRKQYKRRG
jgi:hypothetical protein